MPGKNKKILIDDIDLEILEILDKKSHKGGMGVLELTEKIGLTHANLKTHLVKLIKTGLILPSKLKGTNKIRLCTPEFFSAYSDGGSEREKIAEKRYNEYNGFMTILKKIDNLTHERVMISELSKRLNKEVKDILEKD